MSILLWSIIILGVLVGSAASLLVDGDNTKEITFHIIASVCGALAAGLLYTTLFSPAPFNFDFLSLAFAALGALMADTALRYSNRSLR